MDDLNAMTPLSEGDVTPQPYLRSPCLSPRGHRIAFSYAGDIWVVPRKGGEARLLTSHPEYDDCPRFSPDGRSLAFTSYRTGNGDLYVLSLANGTLRRLTYHDGENLLEAWSPDGQWLYFNSGQEMIGSEIYKVSLAGGTPIRVLGDPYEAYYHVALSPDGRRMAFNNNGDRWWRRGPNPNAPSDIWVADEPSRPRNFRKVTDYAGRNLWPLWDAAGEGLYFVSDRGGTENLWYQSLRPGAPARQVTCFRDGRVLRPSISANGRWIVFQRDFRLWCLDTETGEAAPVDIRVRPDQKRNPVTRHAVDGNIQELALAPDGKKVVYTVRGKIFADFADKEERPRNEAFPVSDTPFREGQVAWSPDSKQIVYVSDRQGEPQVFLYDFPAQRETQLTDSPGPKSAPAFSPDGKYIAFAQAPDQIGLIEVETKQVRPFIRARNFFGPPGPGAYAWSPDSRWIAFIAQDDHYFSNLYVRRLDGEETRQISFLSNIGADGVLWSPDGRFLLFTTGQYREEAQIARVDLKPRRPTFREDDFAKLFEEEQEEKGQKSPQRDRNSQDGSTGLPRRPQGVSSASGTEEEENGEEGPAKKEKEKVEPVEIDFEGIKHRLRFLTPLTMNAHAVAISPDSKTLLFIASPTGKPVLWSLSLEEDKESDPPEQVVASAGPKWGVQFTEDGKKLYYVEEGSIKYRKWPKGDVQTLETRAEFDVDFHREKRQMFLEAWTLLRDHFYDPAFHGCDWEALREQFYPYALGAQTRRDFHEILNLLVGELNASHLGAGGNHNRWSNGYLGLTFDPEELHHGRFRIASILPLGPVAVAEGEVSVGDYLVAVNGQALNGTTNLWQLLRNTVGKKVVLQVDREPTGAGAREVAVRPISAGDMDRLVYRHWVQRNAAYVHGLSGGRLGYVHIRAMSYECYQQFIVDLDTETYDREGVVIDVRFNGGGFIASFILDVLHRKTYTLSSYRDQATASSTHLAGGRVLDKPTILVQNEHSGSNTEMFSEGYRRLGLGKIVGKPTMGAVIWTWGWSLLDGTWFRLPRLKVSTLEGENLERAARPVDIDVDRPPGEADRGEDSQLRVAVETLLAQIDGIP